MTYFIRQIHQFISNDMDDKTLRQQLKAHGVDARRLSRFTQLALLAKALFNGEKRYLSRLTV